MNWKRIPGYSAYEISDHGQVRRAVGVSLYKRGHRKKPGILLKPSGKYWHYALVNDNGKIVRELRANRLVLKTFVGPPPSPKHQALHNNDVASNNYVGNLRWGLPKQNGEDAVKNGKSPKGIKNGGARLKDKDIINMRKDYRSGLTLHQLVKKYGLTLSPVHAAVIGKTWSHLPGAISPRGQGARSDLNKYG